MSKSNLKNIQPAVYKRSIIFLPAVLRITVVKKN